jgi:hypothetical protein
MMEEAVMEAAVERCVGEARRECRMRGKGPAREPRTCETWAGASETRACGHSTEMHTASPGMAHPSSHGMHPPATHVAAKATSRERRWRKSERRTKRTRNETTEKRAVHRYSSLVRIAATAVVATDETRRRPNLFNDFK